MTLRNARCNNKDNTVHVSGGLSVHHQESKTVHTVSGVCQTDSSEYVLAGTLYVQS